MTEPSNVDFDQRTREVYRAWLHAKQAIDYWTGEKDKLEVELMDYMGERTRGTIDGLYVVTHVPGGSFPRFSESRFHEAMPDVYSQFIVPTQRRGFLRRAPSKRSA